MYFRLLNTEVGNKYKQMMKYTLIKIEQIHTGTIVLNLQNPLKMKLVTNVTILH